MQISETLLFNLVCFSFSNYQNITVFPVRNVHSLLKPVYPFTIKATIPTTTAKRKGGNNLSLHRTINTHTLHQWEYHIIPETCSHPDCGTYHTYGIQAFSCQNEQLQPITGVHDVSTKQEFVERLAKLFTEHQLSPVHLQEVIEDFIS